MAPLTLYDVTIPPFLHGIHSLTAILHKATAHAAATSMPESELLEARLVADMAAFIFQIQRLSDAAKLCAVRLADVPNEPLPDTEASFADCLARLDKTAKILEAVDRAAMDALAMDDKEVVLKTRSAEHKFTGREYALQWAIPNFYFHLTTAYALLRMKGVPIGKMDYLGKK